MTAVKLTVNGRTVNADIEPRMHLADFLREKQTLTGTHLGCEHGVCGACTVLVDGAPVRSCITYAVACQGASVTTIEGLEDDEIATELRGAFSREHALQCGYCTPGMLASARDVVLRAPEANEQEIRVAMSGNLCRCTGYAGIIRAVMSVIKNRRTRGIAAVPGAGRMELGPAGSGYAATIATGEIQPSKVAKSLTPAVRLAEDQIGEWAPQASLSQSFTIHRPLAEVWDFLGDPAKVAACLPGASVGGDTSDGRLSGKIRIKVGPISAEFHGVAELQRDPSTHSGTIQGSGRDARGSSATRGRIRYRLLPLDTDATKIEMDVGFLLTGPLAQFSRTDIVQDIAGRMVRVFATNVEAQLSGNKERAGGHDSFDAGGLVFSVFIARIKMLLKRAFGMNERGQ